LFFVFVSVISVCMAQRRFEGMSINVAAHDNPISFNLFRHADEYEAETGAKVNVYPIEFSQLKENHTRVIGSGVRNSTSGLLVASCDEFLYYDDLAKVADVKAAKHAQKQSPPVEKKKAATKSRDSEKTLEPAADSTTSQEGLDAIDLMLEVVESLSQDYDVIWGSMIKQALRRLHPDFSEVNAGYRNFAELLQEAEREGCVRLEYDERRGNYRVDLIDEG